jgi:hypothetical protein
MEGTPPMEAGSRAVRGEALLQFVLALASGSPEPAAACAPGR